MCKDWTRYALGGAALALGLISAPASAHCDFVTGGGFIVRDSGAKANFGVHGGCKKNGPNAPFWGHLNYVDHDPRFSPPAHVRSLTITAYRELETRGAERDPKRKGTREICGTATTNQPGFDVVDFRVEVTDNGEPGVDDIFKIRLGVGGTTIYTTYGDSNNTLGGSGPGGGNIQLHRNNPSNVGAFGGICNI